MTAVPERLRWAVQHLDLSPADEVLEVGCGPGVAVALVCQRLTDGRITAIDRSATAIERAIRRNAARVAAGRVEFEQVDLAAFSRPGRRYDTVFAVNVNLFWVRPAGTELRVLAEHLRPGGTVHLCYEAPGSAKTAEVARTVERALTEHGFTTTVTAAESGAALCVSGRRAPG